MMVNIEPTYGGTYAGVLLYPFCLPPAETFPNGCIDRSITKYSFYLLTKLTILSTDPNVITLGGNHLLVALSV